MDQDAAHPDKACERYLPHGYEARSRADERALGFSYAYAQTCILLMSLRGISERLARTVRRTRGTPAALTASSKSPLRLPAGGLNRPEKLNGSSFTGSSNSHCFDQSEPRCLIETDTSIPVLPRFSSNRQTWPAARFSRLVP